MTTGLKARVAVALGWTEQEVNSMSLQSLRDLVRPISPKLAHEVDLAISDAVVDGPPKRSS